MNSSTLNLMRAIWDAFEKAGPIANAVTIFLFLIALAGYVRWYIHEKLRDKEGQIRRLKEDIERREEELGKKSRALSVLQTRFEDIEGQMPEAILKRSEKELLDGNYGLANRAVVDWLEKQGPTISSLLLYRAEWVASHAAGNIRAMGLAAAEAYAAASVTIYPKNMESRVLLTDLEFLRGSEQQSLPPTVQALVEFDNQARGLFDIDLAAAAKVAEDEAGRRYVAKRYRACLPIARLALGLLVQTVGKTSANTLKMQHLLVAVLAALEKYREALPIAMGVADASACHPNLGPNHPQTLVSRYFVAQILHNVGRSEEALPIAQSTVVEISGHPEFGPNHHEALAARYLLAQILNNLNRSDEALPIAQLVAGATADDSHIGPNHPETLRCQLLIGQILNHLERNEEALIAAQEVVDMSIAHSGLGPAHIQTFEAMYLKARVLHDLKRDEEALGAAQSVADACDAHLDFGPNHSQTLASQYLVALILHNLGRNEEALPIAQNVAKRSAVHPDLGPIHPRTLASRDLTSKISDILTHNGKAPSSVASVEIDPSRLQAEAKPDESRS